MRILFITSEMVPFSKTGGLADVAGALPRHLRDLGLEVRVVTPLYTSVPREGLIRTERAVSMSMAGHRIRAHFWHHQATSTWFVDVPSFFDRHRLYTEDLDEHLRFATLGWAALALCRTEQWAPDIVHCNDWQTGLVPMELRISKNRLFANTRSVFTIHNLGYQGGFGASTLADISLKANRNLLYPDPEIDGWYSFLGTGIRNADLVTTVSPTYAKEIQVPQNGMGLHTLLAQRGVTGILNGIDDVEWNPVLDHYIAQRYSSKSLHRKEGCKRDLLERLSLPYHKGVPVVGMVSRLVAQKGFDILQGPLTHFLNTWDLRVVILGSGETQYVEMLTSLQTRFPTQLRFVEGYDNALAHRIEAGADIFLMPSFYEPCGLNQMYSLAYGTLPVVRKVGGLADTVEHADPKAGTGTGFAFEHYTEEGLGWALGEALAAHTSPRTWQVLQKNAMAIDNSWTDRSRRYLELYESLVTASPPRTE